MEVFARATAVSPSQHGPLGHVTQLVLPELQQVETRIAAQAESFDPSIEAYVSYAVGSRGKRLRPLLALLGGGATGPITSQHVDLAVIVELIHLATLVHDDVMDEAERRRSQPTVNARWGNALSVLLGDCLFAHALNLSAGFEDASVSRGIARAAREVCSGEIIQTQRCFDLQLPVEEYMRIVRMKTGSLFAAAAEFAGVLNQAEPGMCGSLRDFGMNFGAAYQIYDDCLDVAGDEVETGKTLGSDLRTGKLTLPILVLLQTASEFERERCCNLLLEGKTEEVAALLKSPAAEEALTDSIRVGQGLLHEAEASLAHLAPGPHTEALASMAGGLHTLLEDFRS